MCECVCICCKYMLQRLSKGICKLGVRLEGLKGGVIQEGKLEEMRGEESD